MQSSSWNLQGEEVGKDEGKGAQGDKATICFMAPDINENFNTNTYAASTSGAGTL
jgi:hypothetical protein